VYGPQRSENGVLDLAEMYILVKEDLFLSNAIESMANWWGYTNNHDCIHSPVSYSKKVEFRALWVKSMKLGTLVL
jgi:hypothetical protein